MPKEVTQTTEPVEIWRGTARLFWRNDAFGHKNAALFIGGLHVGSIMHCPMVHDLEDRNPDLVWRAWVMTDDDGKQVGWYRTEQEAKDALVDEAIKEIRA